MKVAVAVTQSEPFARNVVFVPKPGQRWSIHHPSMIGTAAVGGRCGCHKNDRLELSGKREFGVDFMRRAMTV